MAEVIIRHPKTDEEYAVQLSDYRHGKHYRQKDGEMVSYADAGFHIVSYGDGSEYHEPAARAHAEPAKADEKAN